MTLEQMNESDALRRALRRKAYLARSADKDSSVERLNADAKAIDAALEDVGLLAYQTTWGRDR